MSLACRTYIAVPSSAWIDDYFEWSVEEKYCCRLHENGSFCRREPEETTDYIEEEGEDGIEGETPERTDDPPEYIGGVDFQDFLDNEYEYDYTYGDLDIGFDHVEELRKNNHKGHKNKKVEQPKYEEDVYNYDYSYGDTSVNFDDGAPLTGAREIPGDDGWPSNSKDPSETRLALGKQGKPKAVRRERNPSSDCHSCPIAPLPNNPYRPDPEVFNQYLPMFLKDNPDIYCPKAGHAAYGQVSGVWRVEVLRHGFHLV